MRARHACGNVSEDQVIPAEVTHEAVTGRQIDTHRPFFGGDLVANIAQCVVDDAHLHGNPRHEIAMDCRFEPDFQTQASADPEAGQAGGSGNAVGK